MDLLKLLIGSKKTVNPCFLCFKSNKNNLDIHTVFEIRSKFSVSSVSLAEMLNNMFPNSEFVFMQACKDCSNLIIELYILLHNRRSKLFLLDCVLKQLIVKSNSMSSIPITDDKLTLNIQVPSYQRLNNYDCASSEEYKNKDTSDCVSNDGKSYKITNLHRDDQKVKICQYCPEIFLETNELKTHLKTHKKKRQRRLIYYYCNNCIYKTLSKTTLQAHINKNHLNTRPHICQICLKGFYNKSNMNEHVKTHSNQRNQVCEQCGCSFIHKKSLIEHLRLHSDTRPYKCDVCHKNFITSGRRSDHFKRSHMEKSECCLICNKKYSLKKELTRHMNNVHLKNM